MFDPNLEAREYRPGFNPGTYDPNSLLHDLTPKKVENRGLAIASSLALIAGISVGIVGYNSDQNDHQAYLDALPAAEQEQATELKTEQADVATVTIVVDEAEAMFSAYPGCLEMIRSTAEQSNYDLDDYDSEARTVRDIMFANDETGVCGIFPTYSAFFRATAEQLRADAALALERADVAEVESTDIDEYVDPDIVEADKGTDWLILALVVAAVIEFNGVIWSADLDTLRRRRLRKFLHSQLEEKPPYLRPYFKDRRKVNKHTEQILDRHKHNLKKAA